MRVRLVTIALLMGLAGCGDDSAPGTNPEAGATDGPSADRPSPGMCDPVAQDCTSGEKCTLNHMMPVAMTFCDMGTGTANEFQGCTPSTSSDDCVRGTVCLNTGDTRTCRRFCNSDTDCGQNICAINIGGTNGLHACAQKCSVLAQDCTTSGEACYLGLNATNQSTQQCSNRGTKHEGDPCDIANDCEIVMPDGGTPVALLCISTMGSDAGNGFFCRRACDTSHGNADCATGDICTVFTGQGNLGYCRVP